MIKKITIDNFKSIRHIEVEIPHFAVIVGNNGAGKSNFLKAIKIVALLASGKQIKDVLRQMNLFSGELLFDKDNPKITISIEMSLKAKEITYLLEITRDKSEETYIYRISREILQNGHSNGPILKRIGEKIEIDTEEGEASSESNLVDSQLAISILKKPEIVSEVQRFLSSILVEYYEPSNLREFGSTTSADFDRNLAEKLFHQQETSQESYRKIEETLKEIVMGVEKIKVLGSGERLYISFKEQTLPVSYTFFSSSDGNLRTLAILVALFQKPKPSAIFLDEIENSLHPTRIKSLLKLLDYYCEKEVKSSQVVLTTHSPVVMEYVDAKQIIYMYKKGSETYISQPIHNKDVLRHLENAAEQNISIGDLFETGILEMIYTSSSQ